MANKVSRPDSDLVKFIAALVSILIMSVIVGYFALAFFEKQNSNDAAAIVQATLPSAITGILGLAAGSAIKGSADDSSDS